jgi:hypothetical protein
MWTGGGQEDEQEALYAGADHPDAAGSRGGLGPGGDGGPGLPHLGHCGAEILSQPPEYCGLNYLEGWKLKLICV